MRKRNHRLFKCPVCDTVVEVLEECGLDLVCCGPSMIPLAQKASPELDSEHAPRVNWTDGALRVSIGGQEHPMDGDHYISWIDLTAGNACYRQFLQPGHPAEATFHPPARQPVVIRVHCSVHGLYRVEASPPPAVTCRAKAGRRKPAIKGAV